MSGNNHKNRIIKLIATLIIASLFLPACSQMSVKSQVRKDLEEMRTAELDEKTQAGLQEVLTDKARGSFDEFMSKVSEFEYEITDVKKPEDENEDGTIVTVRIKTYNFGWEYLRTWTDYFRTAGNDFDQSRFYEMLMDNLSKLESKSYYKDVDIFCFDSDDGSWQTDVRSNKELKDAVLGGMITEIAALADI